MWRIAEYEVVTLFSLRPSAATSSGGKTLLAPTPYAIKMALLDMACRLLGVAEAEARWPIIRDLQIALRLPEKAIVTNSFQKILRPRRSEAKEGDADVGPFQRTIGYREYAQLVGPMGVALGWLGDERREWLDMLLINLSYLGKRGGFVQLLAPPVLADELPPGYAVLTSTQTEFVSNGTLQMLDDCAPALTFAKANVYNDEQVAVGRERLLRPVVLPYRLVRSSKGYSFYERID